MPNWCEGTLKVRGAISELKSFVFKGLLEVNSTGRATEPLIFDEEDDFSFYIRNIKRPLWIIGTHRAFFDPDYIDVCADTKTEKVTMCLPFRQAWRIDAEELLAVCKEYDVDMNIQGFERGLEFAQIITIIDGKIVRNDEFKYDDWNWDCPCPEKGG